MMEKLPVCSRPRCECADIGLGIAPTGSSHDEGLGQERLRHVPLPPIFRSVGLAALCYTEACKTMSRIARLPDRLRVDRTIWRRRSRLPASENRRGNGFRRPPQNVGLVHHSQRDDAGPAPQLKQVALMQVAAPGECGLPDCCRMPARRVLGLSSHCQHRTRTTASRKTGHSHLILLADE